MEEGSVIITVRLAQSAIKHLDHEARMRTMSRQALIEEVINHAITGFRPMPASDDDSLPPTVVDEIQKNIEPLSSGAETSLKKLVGKELWASLDDPLKRRLGKEFKVLVHDGEFPGLKVGRLKSNNEQQYVKE